MDAAEAKTALGALYSERRQLRQEEKALKALIRITREQVLQLQVENMELKARIRLGVEDGDEGDRNKGHEEDNRTKPGTRVRRTSISEQMRANTGAMATAASTSGGGNASSSKASTAEESDLTSEDPMAVDPGVELELDVNHRAILDRMLRGQFVSEGNQEEEEEEEDSD